MDDDDDHIFVATGDACPICSGLDGEQVPPGYRAHANCLCRTRPRKNSGGCEPQIDLDFVMVGGTVIAAWEIEVHCPDGSTIGESGSLSEDARFANDGEFFRAAWEEARAAATTLCASCHPYEPLVA